MILAAIFDLDGTLVDSRQAVVQAVEAGVREVFAREGLQKLEVDRAQIHAGMGLPADEYYRRLLPEEYHALAPAVKEAATAQEVKALAGGHGRCVEGTLKTLRNLRDDGIRLACISNAQAPYFHAALQHLELRPLFEYVECFEELPSAAEPGTTKTRLLRRALAHLRLPAAQCIMVGDRFGDIEAGQKLGCTTVGLLTGFGDAKELAPADHLFPRFPDLGSLF